MTAKVKSTQKVQGSTPRRKPRSGVSVERRIIWEGSRRPSGLGFLL